jgi:hypothetical protein
MLMLIRLIVPELLLVFCKHTVPCIYLPQFLMTLEMFRAACLRGNRISILSVLAISGNRLYMIILINLVQLLQCLD